MILSLSNGDHAIQSCPLSTASKCDATTGTFNEVSIISCTSDGDVNITFKDKTTKTKSFVEGMDRSFNPLATVTIVSGSFDIA